MEPAGLSLLLSVEQLEPRVLLAQGHWFPWSFMVKVAGCVAEVEHGPLNCWEVGFTPKEAPSDGAWNSRVTLGAGDPYCSAASHSSHCFYG
jgi:hypothetical protein